MTKIEETTLFNKMYGKVLFDLLNLLLFFSYFVTFLLGCYVMVLNFIFIMF
jgi:hypothetical protein